jgi:hypothetical protein
LKISPGIISPTTIVKEHTNTLLEQLRGKPDTFYNPDGDDFLERPETYESDEEKSARKSKCGKHNSQVGKGNEASR